jgi:hypothetical protein
MTAFLLALAAILVTLLCVAASNHRRSRAAWRERFIAEYPFPQTVSRKLVEHYPHLTPSDAQRVVAALRNWFSICRMAGRRRMVSMPSQAVDVAWHEFILFTRDYEVFCRSALGRFLHHTPAEAMRGRTLAQDGIKLAWKLACRLDHIDPKKPSRLPLLFALDADLSIPDGFRYTLDCLGSSAMAAHGFCASHIGCSASGCGGGSGDGGWGDGHGGHGHADGGGGCGGSSCGGGGGCGGGGD